MRVVLTGFMGTGKTAVGQRVAERLGRAFVDTDALVERKRGRPVREIFAAEGEAAFRALEREAVAEACSLGDVVVATGGGALIDDANFAHLARDGFLVCLTAEPAAIARRVRATADDRPLLGGRAGLTARIRQLLQERAAIYARVGFTLDTTGRTIDQVADEIVAALAATERRSAGGRRSGGAEPPTQGRRSPRAVAR